MGYSMFSIMQNHVNYQKMYLRLSLRTNILKLLEERDKMKRKEKRITPAHYSLPTRHDLFSNTGVFTSSPPPISS